MKAIAALISVVILIILLIALWLPFDTVLVQMNETVNTTTHLSDAHKTNIQDFYQTLRTIFTITFALAVVGVIAAYFIDAFRREHEEFEEYEKYGPFQ